MTDPEQIKKSGESIRAPNVAIVGRPNVGKSSLFNRITGARRAIVDARSGTTRDRVSAEISYKGRHFTLIDTGGFEEAEEGAMSSLILKQLLTAIKEAEIVLFVTDATTGILPQDLELASQLRKASKKIHLVVNKVDGPHRSVDAVEFYELGLGEPITISALNATGIDALLSILIKDMSVEAAAPLRGRIAIAIVGRPNVGKSSFINALLKEDRVIVHHTAGTTRDAIDIDFNYKGKDFILIDTAGIRHNPKLREPADFYSGVRSREAIKRADVAIVLIDGFDGLREDDIRIIDTVMEEGKALIVAVNKSDLIDNEAAQHYGELLSNRMSVLKNVSTVVISCKTGRNITQSLELVGSAYQRSSVLLSPEEVSRILHSLRNDAVIQGKHITCAFLKQTGALPQTFVLGTRGLGAIPDSVKRHIENVVRRILDLKGVPIKIKLENLSRHSKIGTKKRGRKKKTGRKDNWVNSHRPQRRK